jgi:hypothetical protein
LVVTIRKDKTWRHPDNGTRLDLNGLIAMLNEKANRLTAELGGSIRLMAKGLDLRPRLQTERARVGKPKRRKPRKPAAKTQGGRKKKAATKPRKPKKQKTTTARA